ncbi:MAG TPA: Lrp/AsnC family transcriptional regulator [Firmicutes bacterium]|nr:Lrp/AsnC family transcriptional regulator [Bacillota bacterium]
MDTLLIALENNARLSNRQLAAMLGKTEEEVEAAIEAYEREGVILGYKTLINWDKTDRDLCHARIELKVIPQSGHGFDEIANQLMQYDQVETVYLMSGAYDLALTVRGKSFKDVALFVSQCLAPIDAVQSTSTHFVLKKYKERGKSVIEKEIDTREVTGL